MNEVQKPYESNPIEQSYIIPSHPGNVKENVVEAAGNFKAWFESYSPESKKEILDYFFKTNGHSREISYKLRVPKGVSDKYPSISLNALMSDQNIDVIKTYLESCTASEAVRYLENTGYRMLETLSLGSVEFEQKQVMLISRTSINAFSAWFTDHAFSQLDKMLATITSPGHNQGSVTSLAILGIMYGYLDSDNEFAPYYKRLLAPYISADSPQLLKEFIPPISVKSDAEKRVDKLKKYWHESFVVKLCQAPVSLDSFSQTVEVCSELVW